MLGMELDYLAPAQYLPQFLARAVAGAGGYCCVTNVHQCVMTYDDPDFRTRVNAATFVISDSTILQRARSLRYGTPFLDTMRGADIMQELCQRAEKQNLKIALIGGKDDEVLALLCRKLGAAYPDLDIAFAYSPSFGEVTQAEDEKLVAALQQSGVRIIFVGLGCPKQETWMATHTAQLDAMIIGVGAAFDFIAGSVRPAPAWMHKAGLEWLYRLAREPRRLWKRYVTTSPRFIWLLILDGLGRGRVS